MFQQRVHHLGIETYQRIGRKGGAMELITSGAVEFKELLAQGRRHGCARSRQNRKLGLRKIDQYAVDTIQ